MYFDINLIIFVLLTLILCTWYVLNRGISRLIHQYQLTFSEALTLENISHARSKYVEAILRSSSSGGTSDLSLGRPFTGDYLKVLDDLIKNEAAAQFLSSLCSDHFGSLTRLISFIEASIFIGATVITSFDVIEEFNFIPALLKALFPLISGWILLKVVGSYSQWSLPFTGRASFYKFLIGTVLNIGTSIVLGVVLFWLTNAFFVSVK